MPAPSRRFPPPWAVEELEACFFVTDSTGQKQEVRGAGVVGEEPVIEPGASFAYTSGVPLPTSSGFMAGTYGMVTPDGEQFEIQIPVFSLDSPEAKRTIN